MKKLRLLLTEECNRACVGCCNKGFDLKALPICRYFDGWDEVNLTGGEPMLDPERVVKVAKALPCWVRVNLYTAKVDDLVAMSSVMLALDGLTVTLHEQSDVEPYLRFVEWMYGWPPGGWSLRLNVFKGITLPPDIDLPLWRAKRDIEWIENCPLPEDETFMRLR